MDHDPSLNSPSSFATNERNSQLRRLSVKAGKRPEYPGRVEEEGTNHFSPRSTRAAQRLMDDRLASETARADAAEQRLNETIATLHSVIDERNRAFQDHVRTKEELRLWKSQFEKARAELRRGQDIISKLEAERDQSLADGARVRVRLEKLLLERAIKNAKNTGWALGYQEGVHAARQEMDAPRPPATPRKNYKFYAEEPHVQPLYDRAPTLPSIGPTRVSSPQRLPASPRIPDTFRHAPTLPVPTVTTPLQVPSVAHASPPSQYVGSHARHSHHNGAEDLHPIPSRNSTRSILHPPADPFPDGFIPVADRNSYISIPPPHGLSRIPTPNASPQQPPSLNLPAVRSRDFAYAPDGVPILAPLSPNSTHLSQYDLVSPRSAPPIEPHVVRPLSVRSRTPATLRKHQSPTQKLAEEWRSANPDMAGTGTLLASDPGLRSSLAATNYASPMATGAHLQSPSQSQHQE